MREFLKKLFSRKPPQQLGLEAGPLNASTHIHDTDEPNEDWGITGYLLHSVS